MLPLMLPTKMRANKLSLPKHYNNIICTLYISIFLWLADSLFKRGD